MNKDDALFALFLVLFHHFTKLVQLVIQYFTVAHAAGVIQQLADMQVNLDNPILAATLDDRLPFFSVSKPPSVPLPKHTPA